MFEVHLKNIRKTFGSFEAIKDLSLTFAAGSTTCLLGPSGCGKTTIIRMVAGLEKPTSGEIRFGDKVVNDLSPRRRDIAMVFQYPVVYRGMSVYDNIELPLRDQHLTPPARKARVMEAVELLGLGKNLRDDPDRFDNGVRQRVAFARAIARRASLLLFDEPITNVDHESKLQLKQDLKKLTLSSKQTILYVTHDQNEAMTLADQMILLKDGKIVQQGSPRELYKHPQQRFGGWFLGSPGMNFVPQVVPTTSDKGAVTSALFPYQVELKSSQSPSPSDQGELIFGVRPEKVVLHTEPRGDAVPATVLRKFRGVLGQYLVTVSIEGQELKAKVGLAKGAKLGSQAWIECRPEDVSVFDLHGNRLDIQLIRSQGLST